MTSPRLLALRLQGFKSFADRTVIEFGPGISAIVGPNGSGKSNLADALRWTLGEQGRALRSRRSEDVIFGGSERRAALGMADVTLVLDNSDGLLPVDFRVLELGRRLYRSGENDYLLNRQRVRLKDLIDLLDAARLADNAFLFIGQGMVDQALAMRPEERRPLFEEVAGVRRHERRRRHAEQQLAEAELNLARVEDILAELRPQARRLAAQAQQQATRETAGQELAAAVALGAHARWHGAALRAREAAARLARTAIEVSRAGAGLTDAEAVVAALRVGLAERVTEERSRRAALERAQGNLTAARIEGARLAGEAVALDRDEARLAAEREAATAALAQRRRELALPVPPRDLGLEVALSESERGLADALAELNGLHAARDAHGEAMRAARRAQAAREADLEAARRRLADASERATRERTETDRAVARRDELRAELEAAQRSLALTIDAERALEAERGRLRAAAELAEVEARVATERAAELGGRAANLRGRVEALAAMRREDESRGLARRARQRGGQRIDEGLSVDPDLRHAIEAALGDAVRAYLVPPDALTSLAGERGTAIIRKPQRAGGDASSGVAGRPEAPDVTDVLAQVSELGGRRLADAIREDPSGAVRALLARSVLVPDLAALSALLPALPPGWSAVVPDGSAVAGPMTVRFGRPEGALERAGEGGRLAAELATTDSELAFAVALAADRAEVAGQGRDRLAAVATAQARAAADRHRDEERERAAGRALETAGREAAWHSAQADLLASEARRLRSSLDELEAEGTIDPRYPKSAESVEGRKEAPAVAGWEARVAELRGRRDRLAADADAADRARREAEGRRTAAEAAAAMDEERLARVSREEPAVAARRHATAAESATAAAALADAEAAHVEARARLDALIESDDVDRSRLARAEAIVIEARAQLRSAEDRSRASEAADLGARLELDGVREGVLVELAGLGELGVRALLRAAGSEDDGAGPPLSTPSADTNGAEETLEAAALESALEGAARRWLAEPPTEQAPSPARLAWLRRRYHELGAANPFAPGEYAEIRSRLESLETQERDLRDAIATTRNLIAELSTLIAEQFRTTFRALEGAFDAQFRQLFGGGHAQLSLTDPSDLSATGVEIMARPPGKKAQALAMLSGGERALTAVALLFAMLEVRPVPFCILDEVDAALDEANIGRFADALRSLAATTQFVVITHNRGTIEAADALYGITVGDDSVSRVISLRLDEATALAAKSRGERGRESELAAAG